MKLSKIDLSSLVAIAHTDGYLHLLLDRGYELEFIEIPAPIEAFEGLQELSDIVAETALPCASEPIAMLPVSSSMAHAVGYCSEEQVLQVEFQNGAIYQYSGVEPEIWQELQSTDSIGRFYNQEIKGEYYCDRIDS